MKTAEKYTLTVAAISGEVFIAMTSKKEPHCMTDDRRKVPQSELFGVIVKWLRSHYPDNECFIHENGKPVAMLALIKEEKVSE